MKSSLAVRWLLLVLLWSAAASGAETVRLAIIPEEPALATVADLFTVTLSTNRQVALVEREQLDRVLREQANASANGRDFIKLGQLLGADGLLVLQRAARDGSDVLTCRMIAVKPGVALVIEAAPWPLEKPVEWCQRVAPRFAALFPKLQVARQDAVPISVLNLRSAVRSRENEALERELTLLLIHRLTRERELFVLERQHLHEALFEKELRPEEESPFWTGRYLLDGVLDKSGFDPERLTINARLASAQGVAADIELTGPRKNPAAVADALVGKVLAALHRSPGGGEWKPVQEAAQFFDEAKWAFRWSLWPEAQAASESAWALGLRTPEVAALRIRAYGEEVMRIDLTVTRQTVPRVPEAARLKPARRAVELFSQDAALVFTNGPSTNREWFELGLHTLQRAASMLDGFHNTAELRPGNEEALATLREATRKLIPVLDASRPPRGQWEKLSESHHWRANLEKLDLVKWHQGGVWFDRPEDSLPMFRQMLETGSHPQGLPRIVGWTWADRKRVPAVVRQFVESLRGSTNGFVRLEGLYLAVEREPFDGEGRFHARESELLAALWENRTNLWADAGVMTIVRRTKEALCTKYGLIFVAPLDREPWRSFVCGFRKDYLENAAAWNEAVFLELFSRDSSSYSAAEAAELSPLVEPCKQRLGVKGYPAQRFDDAFHILSQRGGLADRTVAVASPRKPVEFAELFPGLAGNAGEVLPVKFIPWRLRNEGLASGAEPRVTRLIQRGGKLWAMVRYVIEEDSFLMNFPTTYVVVDLTTGACDEIPFPPALGFPDAHFEVTEDSLFASVGDHLQRYRFKTKTWEKVVVPIEGGASITAIGDALYLGSRESLLELDPKTHGVRVLASSRRRPADNELDELWKTDARVFAWPDGWLGVQTGSDVFSLDPTNRVWSKASPPADPRRRKMIPLVSTEGVELLLTKSDRHRLLAFRNHGKDVVSCFLFDKPIWGRIPPAPMEPSFAEPRWQWPTPFDLEYACLLAEQGGLWVWQPRRIPNRFNTPQEPVVFRDGRNATLLWFESGRRQALPLAFRFEKDGQPFDPFEAEQNSHMGWFYGLGPPMPHCLLIPEGMVVSCAWAKPGHWLIPKAELEARLKSLREKLPEAAITGGTK